MVMRAWVLLGLLAGCVVDDVELEETEQEVMSSNRLATNRLATNRLATNRLATNKLALSAMPGSSPLVDTVEGRDVLSYVVSCALPASATLSVTASTGTTYKFPGSIGLAPSWATRAPTVSERRWVTACLLARTNLYGITVNLSLRGDHTALKPGLLEPVTYAIPEAAFYGDLFDPSGATSWYACLALIKDTGLSLSTTQLRECAMPSGDGVTTKCGFTYTGKCGVVDGLLAPACKSLLAPYKDCRTALTANAPTFSEVITVELSTL